MTRNRGEDASSPDEGLLAFAAPRQAEYLSAYMRLGSYAAVARELGVDKEGVRQAILTVRRKAASQGYAPEADMTHVVPAPFRLRGTSTLYDGDGKPRLQWVKTQRDTGLTQEMMAEIADWLSSQEVAGKAPRTPPPLYSEADLLAVYPMGDPHFGMYAWARECGQDFDVDIAQERTERAIDFLVQSAPAAKRALLINLGDFFHGDNESNQTPGHGHPLDIDTRYAYVVPIGIKAMVHCVLRLLEKHEEVDVWNMPGNHDPVSGFWLAITLQAWFRDEPRVRVNVEPGLFKYLRFGKVLIGAHHGHTAKLLDLPAIMAQDRRSDWGEAVHCHWYVGHIHHRSVRAKEDGGCTVESFRTLAPQDAWHTAQGYRAAQDMVCIVHHKEWGEIGRQRFTPHMFMEAA